jgi:hypothetical protein
MVILVPGARSYVLWQGSRYLALVTLRRVIPGTEVSNRQRLSFCADTLRISRDDSFYTTEKVDFFFVEYTAPNA